MTASPERPNGIDKTQSVDNASTSIPVRFAISAGGELDKLEIGWLFQSLPTLLQRFWLYAMVAEPPVWPTTDTRVLITSRIDKTLVVTGGSHCKPQYNALL